MVKREVGEERGKNGGGGRVRREVEKKGLKRR